MNCDPNALLESSKCFSCIPKGVERDVRIYLLCVWANRSSVVTTIVIIDDGTGHFWRLVVDTSGNLGAESDPGPATPAVVLDDGGGGFWEVKVDTSGLRYADSSLGPATSAPVLGDGGGGFWQLEVDTSGNIGTHSV